MAKNKVKDVAKEVAPSISGPDDEWQAKSHANTIMDAHEIMADPDKMKKVKKHLHAKKKAMKSVQDLMDYRNEKYGGKNADKDQVEEDDGV